MDLAKFIDHTLLKASARESEIHKLCAEAIENKFFSVCVNPRWVSLCRSLLSGSPIFAITVVGFPLGANELQIKQKEAALAIEKGADEIDMVIDVENALDHDWKSVEAEIKALSRTCGRIPLKVIIETAYLGPEEIREASKCCLFGGAHFVKTSTGFAPSGAKEEDIKIIKEVVHPTLGIKASGGIKSLQDAEKMIAAGATRIGSSASVAIVQEWKSKNS